MRVIIDHTRVCLYRSKDALRLLEVYSGHARTGKLQGPRAVWHALLLMPGASFWLLIAIAQLLDSRGWLVLGGVSLISYFIYNQVREPTS